MDTSVEAPDVIYQDDQLIAINKPAGMLVHRSKLDAHETRFALQWVRDHIGQRVYPLHRLDKATSGVLAFAKSPEVARHWSQAWHTNAVHKTYLALVRGWPDSEGTINHPLRDPDSAPNSPKKEAETTFKTLNKYLINNKIDRYDMSRFSLLGLHPNTGRRHQLRQHLKHINHPIIGDVRYGKGTYNRWARDQFDEARLFLHAHQLHLNDANTDITITAAPNTYWQQCIEFLNNNTLAI
ncbi:MAG: pseudouridine synthase [Halieaceae bacterium]|nr:pseudouridine synthase [Halieaceae bacterium]